jgi:hypothetical protein
MLPKRRQIRGDHPPLATGVRPESHGSSRMAGALVGLAS